jgi:hypothetical protein
VPEAPSLSCPPARPARAALRYSGKDGSFRMATKARKVTGGVDTHGQTHHAAVVDALGRQLADRQFPTTPRRYRALLSWLAGFGQLMRVGWKAPAPTVRRWQIFAHRGCRGGEGRPARPQDPATKGKSDPVDAYVPLSAVTHEIRELASLLTATAPQLLALPGVGIDVAGQLLVTAEESRPAALRSRPLRCRPDPCQLWTHQSPPTKPRRRPISQHRIAHHCVVPIALGPAHSHVPGPATTRRAHQTRSDALP